MKPQTSPAIAQEIRRLIDHNGGNKCHPALVAAQAHGHLQEPISGQALTAHQADTLPVRPSLKDGWLPS